MIQDGPWDLPPTPRPRRGPPPRLYVIARQAPVPWVRVRRLTGTDRPALLAHFRHLAGTHPGVLAETSCLPQIESVILYGAVAGRTLVAAACGIPDGQDLAVAVTEDPAWRQQGLGETLARQVRGAWPCPAAVGGEAALTLLSLMRRLGLPADPLAEAATG